MFLALGRCTLVVAFSVCAAVALAQTVASGGGMGRPLKGAQAPAVKSAKVNAGKINPAFKFNNASFATGGVGLRNLKEGGVNVSGFTGPVRKALLYWAVITQGPPDAKLARLKVKFGGGNGTFFNVAGTAVGTGDSPCWAGDRTTVFRGNLPAAVAKGNGLYIIKVDPTSGASTSGDSPWVESEPPMIEGASIVLIGSGGATVGIYDKGLAGEMFFDQLSYRLASPASVAGAEEVLFHTIGADGQVGVGVEQIEETSAETTSLNGRKVAGPGSGNAGDWNGATASPLPQLWDNRTYDVTAAATAGQALLLPFTVKAPDDCLVPVANLISVRRN